MTTGNAPGIKEFKQNSLEKKCYALAEELSQFLPVRNDRYRLAYNLVKFKSGEGDAPEIIIKTNKFTVAEISKEELASIIDDKLQYVI